MKRKIFESSRRFQIWSYIVSHRQLLLRSTKAANWPTRIDILFKDVSVMCLGTAFDGMSIQEIERNSTDLPFDISHIQPDHRLFQLTANTATGYVAAANLEMSEDEKEYYDESALVAAEHL